jgi:hypothetical protein
MYLRHLNVIFHTFTNPIAVSDAGKIIVAISSVISIMVVAIPYNYFSLNLDISAGMLGWGFQNIADKMTSIRKQMKDDKRKQKLAQQNWKQSLNFLKCGTL